MDLNWFDNYTVDVLRPQNSKSGEPDLKKSVDKFQENNAFINNSSHSDLGWNQTLDMI